MIAKVDSIILTLIDLDKTEDYIRQKHKGIKLLIKEAPMKFNFLFFKSNKLIIISPNYFEKLF